VPLARALSDLAPRDPGPLDAAGQESRLPAVGREAERVGRDGVVHHNVAVEAGRRKVRVAEHVPHGRQGPTRREQMAGTGMPAAVDGKHGLPLFSQYPACGDEPRPGVAPVQRPAQSRAALGTDKRIGQASVLGLAFGLPGRQACQGRGQLLEGYLTRATALGHRRRNFQHRPGDGEFHVPQAQADDLRNS